MREGISSKKRIPLPHPPQRNPLRIFSCIPKCEKRPKPLLTSQMIILFQSTDFSDQPSIPYELYSFNLLFDIIQMIILNNFLLTTRFLCAILSARDEADESPAGNKAVLLVRKYFFSHSQSVVTFYDSLNIESCLALNQ